MMNENVDNEQARKKTPPQTLYHYCGVNAFYEIVTGKEICVKQC